MKRETVSSPVIGDIDGDGDPDLIAANHATNDFAVLKNKGDGTFEDAMSYPAGFAPQMAACDDLDGDGDIDIAIVNRDSDNIFVYSNLGDGTFIHPML